MICPKCNSNMEIVIENKTEIIKCMNCDYNIATTFINEIENDETIYTLKIISKNISKDMIKYLGKMFRENYLSILKKINDGTLTISNEAKIIVEIIKKLDEEKIEYIINPIFK